MPVKPVTCLSDLDSALSEAGSKLVVVDFFATWCGPCKVIGPKLEELSNTLDFVALKVDVDNAEDVAGKYEIKAMPTFIFFKNGQKVGEMVGANAEKLKQEINNRM
uniref:Thioredoxin n=1 Tax=Phallusia mammillata TaxID=59560 RepID=A0A6F9DMG8_9ASCI|nr:thioredoxin-2 [Phallusia mammillata]